LTGLFLEPLREHKLANFADCALDPLLGAGARLVISAFVVSFAAYVACTLEVDAGFPILAVAAISAATVVAAALAGTIGGTTLTLGVAYFDAFAHAATAATAVFTAVLAVTVGHANFACAQFIALEAWVTFATGAAAVVRAALLAFAEEVVGAAAATQVADVPFAADAALTATAVVPALFPEADW